MPRSEEVHIQRHVTYEELIGMIKSEENPKVLVRLFFVKYRYEGKSVIEASQLVGISRRVAYIWQSRWNEGGHDALIPRWGGGRTSKLSNEEKDKLKQILHQKEGWTTDEVHGLIIREFGVDYSLKQVRVILRQFGMNYAKPYPRDHRRPDNAEEILKKKLPTLEGDVIIGFLDEASPQTTANTQRLWSFGKPKLCKNTSKIKLNVVGFYAINGVSVIDFKTDTKKANICEVLERIRRLNPSTRIVIVLDRYASHRAGMTRECAKNLEIELVYLPPYSPHLNPIELIWKSIKRVISNTFIINEGHMKNVVDRYFIKYSSQLSFAKAWIGTFLDENLKCQLLGA